MDFKDFMKRRRPLFFYYCVMVLMTLGVIEGMAQLFHFLIYDEFYTNDRLITSEDFAETPRILRSAEYDEPESSHQVIHPYYGYTENILYWPLNLMPPRKTENSLVIGVLGGSVSQGVTPALNEVVQAYFEDNNLALKLDVLSLNGGGMKQPQQLMIVANMLHLGGSFDILVNVDGLNELVGSLSVYRPGDGSFLTFPFFPQFWHLRVNQSTEEMVRIGRIRGFREEQMALLRFQSDRRLPMECCRRTGRSLTA